VEKKELEKVGEKAEGAGALLHGTIVDTLHIS